MKKRSFSKLRALGLLIGALVPTTPGVWAQGFGYRGGTPPTVPSPLQGFGGGLTDFMGRGIRDPLNTPCPWPPRPMDECMGRREPPWEKFKPFTESAPSTYTTRESPKISVKRDERGNVIEVTNLTDEQLKLEDGLVLGPKASLDLLTNKILSGYVIRDGIKYTSEGTIENPSKEVVLLDQGDEPIVLGPGAVLTGEGKILTGYVIFQSRKYRPWSGSSPTVEPVMLPQHAVVIIQYAMMPQTPTEQAVAEAFEEYIEVRFTDKQSVEVRDAKLAVVGRTRAKITGTITVTDADGTTSSSKRSWEFKRQDTRWLLAGQLVSSPGE